MCSCESSDQDFLLLTAVLSPQHLCIQCLVSGFWRCFGEPLQAYTLHSVTSLSHVFPSHGASTCSVFKLWIGMAFPDSASPRFMLPHL